MGLPRRLPHLEGVRGRVATGIYVLVLLPTLLAVACGLWFATADTLHNFPETMGFGFRTYTAADGSHRLRGYALEAARAGLQDEDRIVAVDGRPLRAGASEFDVGERLRAAGPRVALTVRGVAGELRTATLTRQSDPWQRTEPWTGLPLWAYAAVNLLMLQAFPLVMIGVSLLLFLRRPRDPEAMLFALSLLLLCVRSGALWWWEGAFIPNQVLQCWWVLGWAGVFIAVAGFPDGHFASRPARWALALLLMLMLASPVFVGAGFAGALHGRFNTARELFNLLIVGGAILAGIAVLLRYRRTRQGAERQQIKWAVGGSCITLAGVLLLVFVEASGTLAKMTGNPVVYVLLSLLQLVSVTALPLGLMVSLLRFRLYDAEATMSRSAVYAALTLLLLAIFAGGEKLVEALGQAYFGGSLGAVAGGIAATLAAVTIAPLHTKLSAWSERRFQRGVIALRQGLPLLVGDLRETAALPELARAVLKRVEGGVRARHAALIVGEEVLAANHIAVAEIAAWRRSWAPRQAEGLDCARGDLVFPMRVPLEADGCGRLGWLLLGPRPDGSFYGKDEREALAVVADPVARAIAIVVQREQGRLRFETRIDALEAAVARLLGGKGAAA